MTRAIPKWKIELRTATYPSDEWVPLRHESGKLYQYVDRMAAETELEERKRVQPHATFRIRSM